MKVQCVAAAFSLRWSSVWQRLAGCFGPLSDDCLCRIASAISRAIIFLLLGLPVYGGSWSQTAQQDFQGDQLSQVSVTNSPGDVILFQTREVTGRILQPSFESNAGWGTQRRGNGYLTVSYGGPNFYGSGLPTDGTHCLWEYSSSNYTPVVGDFYTCTQRVDFTGIQEISFDAAFVAPDTWLDRVKGEIRIDGVSRWLNTAGGTKLNNVIDVSDLTGSHVLEARFEVITYWRTLSAQYIFWDNFRTYQAQPYYKSSGTLLSPEINPPAFDRWQNLTFDAAVPANSAIKVDVLDTSLVVIATNVISGSDLYSMGVTQTPVRIRATLVSSNGNVTPILHEWAINWADNSAIAKVEFAFPTSNGREDVASPAVNVFLSPVQSQTVSVSYAVSGGTASNGLDWILVPGSLVFDPGQTNKSVPLQIIDDSLVEGDETIQISLSSPSNAVLGVNCTDTFTILGDGDLDGMEDDWEILYFGNLSHEGSGDSDSDGLTDLEEHVAHTVPTNPDTDGDGIKDGDELYGNGTHGDKDGYVTDPGKADTDGDGYSDGYEVAQGRHPANPYDIVFDADGDGLADYAEQLMGTDATNAASPLTVYVNGATGSDATGDGTSAKPYATVQKGINSAAAPAIVRIAAGLYRENLKAKDRIALVGDGAATTVLDGNTTGKVIEFADNSIAVVANLSIINGQHQGGLDYTEGGSGMFLKGGSAYLCGVAFRDNRSTSGKKGTVYLFCSTVRAENCEFRNNLDYESAVEVAGSNEFINCLFADNSMRCMFNVDGTFPTIVLRNCTLANNSQGIQLFPTVNGSIRAYNCIFWGNGTDELYANFTTLDHCCTDDATDPGPGVIHSNPLFAGAASSNYQLSAASPCVDAGNGNQAPPRDAFGRLRVDNPSATNVCIGTPAFVDMGYAELDDADADGLGDYWEMKYFGNLTHDGSVDSDSDGLTDREEYEAGTDPTKADTDGDGLKDGDELYGDGTHGDTDGFETNPLNPDSDGDGILDAEEVKPGADGYITNPNSADTDCDGTSDPAEIAAGRDPSDSGDLDEDEDEDGLPLYGEMLLGTDPRNAESPASIYVNTAAGSDVTGSGSAARPFATIQKAVYAARPPAIIRISAGTYNEHVVGKLDVALVGSGADKTIIDAQHTGSPVSGVRILNGLSLVRGPVEMPRSPSYLRGVDIRNVAVGGSDGKTLAFTHYFRMSGCRVVDNDTWYTVYASLSGSADMTMINCLLANNAGKALTAYWCNPLKIINCTIANNDPAYGETMGQIYQQSSRLLVYNSVFKGGGINGGAEVHNCNTNDPLFAGESYEDYQLGPDSPCLDVADGFIAPKKDLAGYLRHDDPGVLNAGIGWPRYADLGCFEADFTDVDGDGLPDRWEIANFGGLGYNGSMDPDNDGLSNQEELVAHTDPNDADTDKDGISDGDELYGDGTHGDKDGYVTDPLNPDTDGDGIMDGEEVIAGADGYITRPDVADTDRDGYTDGYETANGMNPLDNSDIDSDQDGDGLPILGEAILGSDPRNPASPTRIYVATTGSDSTGQGTAGSPYATIQKGIDVAVAPAAIRVAQGTYRERITVKDKVAIIGEGRGKTIIDAAGSGNPVTVAEGANVALIGMTLTGGGLAINAYQTAPSTRTLYLYEVNAVGNAGSSLTCYYGYLRVSRCFFRNTTSDGFAYEVYLYGVSDPVFVNTAMATADQGYAILRLDSCGYPKLSNCTIVHNHGRGVFYDDDHTITIANSILRTARSGPTLDVVVASAEGGKADLSNCCLAQSGLGGANNIVADPRFFDPGTGDFSLLSDSPCIDAADGAWLPSTDLNGMPRNDYPGRPNTGTGTPPYGDMGCYEFGDSDMDGLADAWEIQFFGNLSHDGSADGDADGLTDKEEYFAHTDPGKPDTDSDGIKDGDELYGNGTYGDLDGLVTDPLDSDCDNDGILDGEEVKRGADGYVTDPHNADTDYDGLSDGYEVANLLNPTSNGDSDQDRDGDGLTAYEEIAIGSNPANGSSPVAVYVRADGGSDTTGDGSAGAPYATIQKGIDSATALPAVIKIAAGDYPENLILKDKVALCGSGSTVTTLDAMGTGIGVSVPQGANVAIAGISILNSAGNAIYCPGDDSSPADRIISLRDLLIEGNRGVVAVDITGGTLRIINSIIRNNKNPLTGKYDNSSLANLYCYKVAKASLINCLVANGRNGDGTAFGITGAGATFHYCPSVLIANCSIVNNEPMGLAGFQSNFLIANSIIWGNKTTSIILNCWLMPWSDTVDLWYGHVQWLNCVVDDPKIAGVSRSDPMFTDIKSGNCQLRAGSPAIDAGFGPAAPPTDIRGAGRVDDPAVPNTGSGSPPYADLGCYEYVDVDRDGMDDNWEIRYFGNLAHTGSTDTDSDGLTDREEFDAGTNPLQPDTDHDGLKDGDELYGNGTHGDLDGFTSNPNMTDTDDDGIPDGEEVHPGADRFVTNPSKADTDRDGMRDDFEVDHGLNPDDKEDNDADPDGDGLPTFGEIAIGSLVSNAASPARLYVSVAAGSDSTGDGTVFSPYASIGKAVSVASTPCAIHISSGVYHEHVSAKSGMALLGSGCANTIVSADGHGCAIEYPEGAGGAVVGLSVTGGNTNHGSGLYLPGTNSTRCFYLRDVTASNNVGGGVEFRYGVLRARNCMFTGNTPGTGVPDCGGGLVCRNADVALINCLSHHNERASATEPTLMRNGDGVALSYCRSSIINCTVAHNKRFGISSEYGSLMVANSIVFYNTPNSVFYEVRNDITGHGDMTITSSTTMNLIPGENIAVRPETIDHYAPLFSSDGKYMLLPNSPCIDAGNGDYAPARDYYGNARVDTPAAPNWGRGSPPYSDRGYCETTDSDLDGMTDAWEVKYFGNLSHNGSQDSDSDGLTDVEEFMANTHPVKADTDGDGLRDGNELYADGTHGDIDGLVSSPLLKDTDEDGISDNEEVVAGSDGYVTDPARSDSDGDGFSDGYEVLHELNPADVTDLDSDPDGDGLPSFGEILIGSVATNPASPASIYVNSQSGNDVTGDGTAGHPFATIQKGINSAGATPVMVRIAAGEYHENLVLRERTALVGEGSRNTIIDGSAVGRVVEASGITNCVLAGLSIRNGDTTGSGAGLQASWATNCSLYLFDVSMVGNHAFGDGGGVSVSNGLLRVVSSQFQQNTASKGGGLYCYNVHPCALVNCIITDNDADSGDGLYVDRGFKGAEVINCTVANNLGQGIMFDCGWGTLINSLVWNNGENVARNADVSCQNNILTISCRIGSDGDGSGVTPAFYNPLMGDYHIMANSSLIDGGRAMFMPSTDSDKGLRWDDPAHPNAASSYDIGAYEFADTDADGLPDYWEKQFFGNLSASAVTDYDGDGLLDANEYACKANPLLTDSDGDGQSDGDEAIAGTDLNDPDEVFRIRGVENDADMHAVVWWKGVTGRLYSVYVSTNLMTTWCGVAGHTGITGTGSSMSYTNTSSSNSCEHYQLRVRSE